MFRDYGAFGLKIICIVSALLPSGEASSLGFGSFPCPSQIQSATRLNETCDQTGPTRTAASFDGNVCFPNWAKAQSQTQSHSASVTTSTSCRKLLQPKTPLSQTKSTLKFAPLQPTAERSWPASKPASDADNKTTVTTEQDRSNRCQTQRQTSTHIGVPSKISKEHVIGKVEANSAEPSGQTVVESEVDVLHISTDQIKGPRVDIGAMNECQKIGTSTSIELTCETKEVLSLEDDSDEEDCVLILDANQNMPLALTAKMEAETDCRRQLDWKGSDGYFGHRSSGLSSPMELTMEVGEKGKLSESFACEIGVNQRLLLGHSKGDANRLTEANTNNAESDCEDANRDDVKQSTEVGVGTIRSEQKLGDECSEVLSVDTSVFISTCSSSKTTVTPISTLSPATSTAHSMPDRTSGLNLTSPKKVTLKRKHSQNAEKGRGEKPRQKTITTQVAKRVKTKQAMDEEELSAVESGSSASKEGNKDDDDDDDAGGGPFNPTRLLKAQRRKQLYTGLSERLQMKTIKAALPKIFDNEPDLPDNHRIRKGGSPEGTTVSRPQEKSAASGVDKKKQSKPAAGKKSVVRKESQTREVLSEECQVSQATASAQIESAIERVVNNPEAAASSLSEAANCTNAFGLVAAPTNSTKEKSQTTASANSLSEGVNEEKHCSVFYSEIQNSQAVSGESSERCEMEVKNRWDTTTSASNSEVVCPIDNRVAANSSSLGKEQKLFSARESMEKSASNSMSLQTGAELELEKGTERQPIEAVETKESNVGALCSNEDAADLNVSEMSECSYSSNNTPSSLSPLVPPPTMGVMRSIKQVAKKTVKKKPVAPKSTNAHQNPIE